MPEQRLSRVSNPLLSYEYPVLTPHAPWLGSVQNPSQLSFLYHYHTRSHAGLLCVVVITLLTGIRHNEHPSTTAHPVVFLVNVRMVSPGCAVTRVVTYGVQVRPCSPLEKVDGERPIHRVLLGCVFRAVPGSVLL